MKLLLVTCLVASVFAAPTERSKKDVLPGDPRYDAQLHRHHHHYRGNEAQRANEVEISRALGGFTGSFAVPDPSYGVAGIGAAASPPPSRTELLKQDIDVSTVAVDSDTVKIGTNKAFERLESVTESSTRSPAVESVTVFKPSSIGGSGIPTSTDYAGLVSQTKVFDASNVSSKNADETKVLAKSVRDGTLSGASKAVTKTVIDANSSAKEFSGDIGLVTDGLTIPFFDSSLDSSLTPFGQSGYNPSFHAVNEYSPQFTDFNTNYEYYNNYGGYPLDISPYSGSSQGFKSQAIGSQSPVRYSGIDPVPFSKDVPYFPSSALPSTVSVTETTPSVLKISSSQSYQSPPREQTKQQFVGTVDSQGQQQAFRDHSFYTSVQPTASVDSRSQQQVFKNYSPYTLTQPTAQVGSLNQQVFKNYSPYTLAQPTAQVRSQSQQQVFKNYRPYTQPTAQVDSRSQQQVFKNYSPYTLTHPTVQVDSRSQQQVFKNYSPYTSTQPTTQVKSQSQQQVFKNSNLYSSVQPTPQVASQGQQQAFKTYNSYSSVQPIPQVVSQDRQQLFKNYSPYSLVQPTSQVVSQGPQQLFKNYSPYTLSQPIVQVGSQSQQIFKDDNHYSLAQPIPHVGSQGPEQLFKNYNSYTFVPPTAQVIAQGHQELYKADSPYSSIQPTSQVRYQTQQQVVKNYSPHSLVQPTSASLQSPIQSGIQVNEASSSGTSQVTDSNGGYIY